MRWRFWLRCFTEFYRLTIADNGTKIYQIPEGEEKYGYICTYSILHKEV